MRRRGGARRRAYYRLVHQALSKTALQMAEDLLLSFPSRQPRRQVEAPPAPPHLP